MTPSERAVRERVRNRGSHQPITTTKVLLKVRPTPQPECKNLAISNTEPNATVTDTWGPSTSATRAASPPPAQKACKRPHSAPKPSSFKSMLKIYTPLKTHNLGLKLQQSLHPCSPSPTLIQKPKQPQTSRGVHLISDSTIITSTAQEAIQCSGNICTSNDLKHASRHVDFEISRQSRHFHNPLDPFRESGGFQLRTDTQLEEYKQTQTQANTLPKEEKKRQGRTSWTPKVKVASFTAPKQDEEDLYNNI